MKYLALDIGKRRTGVAYGDSLVGIALPLSTIHHQTIDDLITQVIQLIKKRAIDEVIIGLPLLLSGRSGSQALLIEQCINKIREYGVLCTSIDERYTTPRIPNAKCDALAACAILETKLEREKGC